MKDSDETRYWVTDGLPYMGDPFGDAVELTYEQYHALWVQQLPKEIREMRDKKIEDVEWRVKRHQDEVALGLEPTEDITPVLVYIQALREVPQQEGFPENVVWPEAPDDRQL